MDSILSTTFTNCVTHILSPPKNTPLNVYIKTGENIAQTIKKSLWHWLSIHFDFYSTTLLYLTTEPCYLMMHWKRQGALAPISLLCISWCQSLCSCQLIPSKWTLWQLKCLTGAKWKLYKTSHFERSGI